MDRQVVIDLERELRNASRRWARRGNHDKAEAYRYAASLTRRALREESTWIDKM